MEPIIFYGAADCAPALTTSDEFLDVVVDGFKTQISHVCEHEYLARDFFAIKNQRGHFVWKSIDTTAGLSSDEYREKGLQYIADKINRNPKDFKDLLTKKDKY